MSRDGIGKCWEAWPDRVAAGQGRRELESPGVERLGFVGGGGGLVSQVVGVPQECVKCTHRPPLRTGKEQERIVKVPGLSPRQDAAESVAGLECPIRLHGEFSAGDDPVASSTCLGRARTDPRRRETTAAQPGPSPSPRSRGPASEAWSTASRPGG